MNAARCASAAVLAVAAWLAGCASNPASFDPTTPWTTGRMSLRVDASGERPVQSVSASFELRGDGTRGELRLLSPLGTSLAHARWAPGQVGLETPEGWRSFDSLEALSQSALGESLPLAALPSWLAGRPWAGAEHLPVADGFEQLGWQVNLARQAEGFIEARRAAAPAVQLRIRIDAPA